jgi:hypothetical protein
MTALFLAITICDVYPVSQDLSCRPLTATKRSTSIAI